MTVLQLNNELDVSVKLGDVYCTCILLGYLE